MIDWKSLIPSIARWIVMTLLTVIATKWADSALVIQRLMAGDTVPLWNGAINLNLGQIQLWLTTGLIALVGAVIGWIKHVRLKREANIALQLPKGATKSDVKQVSEASPTLSVTPDPVALSQAVRSIASFPGRG